MAELPELGQHCSICSILDYLPVKCVDCKQFYCKDHRISHGCINKDKQYDPSTNNLYNDHLIKCHFCAKSAQITQSTVCNYCQHRYCLDHRHQKDHGCTITDNKSSNNNSSEKTKIQTVFNNNKSGGGIIVKNRGAKNNALASKVKLMKLKSQASGQESIPIEEREYFYLSFIVNNNEIGYNQEQKQFTDKPVFLCREWSIGKCVDWLAQKYSLINRNNESGKAKLILKSGEFNDDDRRKCCCDKQQSNNFICFSHGLNDLLLNNVLNNGDKLILTYHL